MLALLVLLTPPADGQEPCVPQQTDLTAFQLQWTPPPAVSGATLQGYSLERAIDGGPWVPYAFPPPTARSLTDTLAVGTTAAYRLAAQFASEGGTQRLSPWAPSGTPPPCVTVQAAPASLALRATVACDAHCVELTWTRPSPDPVVSVLRQISPGPPSWQVVAVVMDARYVDTEVKKKQYCYRLSYNKDTLQTPEVCVTID